MIDVDTVVDNRYRIQSVLGTGAFGTVYQAWQVQFDRVVALKTLNTTVLDEADGLARFEREARAISAIKHKNTIAFYGFGVWDHTPYMVMEFVEGISLESVLQEEGHLEPEHAVAIAKQVCQALQCAHAHGIVHRDLKPSNVMIVRSPGLPESIKIIDFGLAKLMPGYGIPAQRLTEAGVAVGTCHYMSPEQCIGGATVDHRTDIYSLGCILYEMLVGKMPFAGSENVAVMFQHVKDEPPRLPEGGTDSRMQALQAILDNSMAKELNKRYFSAQQMDEDLAAIASGNYGTLAAAGRSSKRSLVKKALMSIGANKPLLTGLTLASSICVLIAVTAGVLVKAPEANPKSSPELYTKAQRFYRLAREDYRPKELFTSVEQALDAHRRDSLLTLQQHLSLLRIAQGCYLYDNQTERAQSACSEAISLATTADKDGWVDWQHLARSRELIGDLKGAKSVLMAAMTEPNSTYGPDARQRLVLELSRVLTKLGELEEARRILKDLSQQHITFVQAAATCWYQLGEAEYLLGNYKTAREHFARSIEYAQGEAKGKLALARCDLKTMDPGRLQNLRILLSKFEEMAHFKVMANAAILKIGILANLGQKPEAEIALNRLVAGQCPLWSEQEAITRDDENYCLQALQKAGYSEMEARCRQYLKATTAHPTTMIEARVVPR